MKLSSPRRSFLLAAFCLAALCACSDMVKVNDDDVQIIIYKELIAMQADKKEGFTVVVDVRQPAKFAAGHIPGAINIFLPKIVPLDGQLTGAKNIVVYAGGFNDVLSVAAAKRMISQRYQNVFDFRGGIEEWQSEGATLEGTATTAPASQPVTK